VPLPLCREPLRFEREGSSYSGVPFLGSWRSFLLSTGGDHEFVVAVTTGDGTAGCRLVVVSPKNSWAFLSSVLSVSWSSKGKNTSMGRDVILLSKSIPRSVEKEKIVPRRRKLEPPDARYAANSLFLRVIDRLNLRGREGAIVDADVIDEAREEKIRAITI